MSEYTEGPLNGLRDIFLRALRDGQFKRWQISKFIQEWNSEIDRLNQTLKAR